MAANILIIAIMIRIMIIGIQIGLNTHHHDHVIVPMSLRTIKTIASNPQNPIPPLLPEDLLMLSPCELYRTIAPESYASICALRLPARLTLFAPLRPCPGFGAPIIHPFCELYRTQRSRIHNREVWLLLTLAIAGLNEPAYEKSQDRGRF
jgi:hypothetical protein